MKPKYLNTGDTPIFNKRLGVFAANLLKKQRGLKRVILTEGYMDVIALVQAGCPASARRSARALTLEQARLLKRYAPEIWVSYDGDAAGQHAILRALDIFEEEGVPARVLDFPGGMDPDEYIKTYGPQSVEQLRPTDATAYRMKQEAANHDLSTEEGRTAYAIACAKYLAKVKEPVELENYVKQLMVSTGFTREVLLAQIGRTELIEENKRPMFRHAARPLEEKNDGVDTETAAAEKGLLVLLAEGGIEPGTISADDFISPQRRALAQKLLDVPDPGGHSGRNGRRGGAEPDGEAARAKAVQANRNCAWLQIICVCWKRSGRKTRSRRLKKNEHTAGRGKARYADQNTGITGSGKQDREKGMIVSGIEQGTGTAKGEGNPRPCAQ